MQRDKQATCKKIIEAVGTLLNRQGFTKLTINAIAHEAGVDKVLIYRYFGGLERLLKTYAEEHAQVSALPPLVWKTPAQAEVHPLAEIMTALLCNQLDELRRRPIAQEIIRWELTEKNALTQLMAVAREKQIRELLGNLPFDQDYYPNIDLAAIYALLHAGLTHLAVSASKIDFYQGIDLKSARGWRRTERAIEALLRAFFNQSNIKPGKHRI